MKHDFDPDRFFDQVAASEPRELQRYLAHPQEDRVYISGSMVPMLGRLGRFEKHRSGLLIPATGYAERILDQGGMYVTVNEYMALGHSQPDGVDALLRLLLNEMPREDALVNLAVLNRAAHRDDEVEAYSAEYAELLPPDDATRLRTVMTSGERWRFLTRQPILMAMRHVLSSPEPKRPARRLNPMFAVTLLTHAVAAKMGGPQDGRVSGSFAGLDERLAMDFVSNAIFNRGEDTLALIERHMRLWREYGPQLRRYPGPKRPSGRFRDIAKLDVEEMFGLAFGAWAHVNKYSGEGYGFAPSYFKTVDPAVFAAFAARASAPLDEMAHLAAEPDSSPWDFLAFEKFPLLRLGDNFFVLDETLLVQRATSGLYWDVFDAEKARGAPTTPWTQTYGEMVEMMAEDSVRRLVPGEVLGERSRYFDEEDLERAYGRATRKADSGIWANPDVLLFEVVSGALTVPSRTGGDVAKFLADTEKLVLKKAKQLDRTSTSLLASPGDLLGVGTYDMLRIVPVVVVFNAYPVNAITTRLVNELVGGAKLFQDARVAPLAIIDFGELELLEGLAERGIGAASVLRGWKGESPDESLRNYVLRQHGRGPDGRPSRMRPVIDALMEDIIVRLGLRG